MFGFVKIVFVLLRLPHCLMLDDIWCHLSARTHIFAPLPPAPFVAAAIPYLFSYNNKFMSVCFRPILNVLARIWICIHCASIGRESRWLWYVARNSSQKIFSYMFFVVDEDDDRRRLRCQRRQFDSAIVQLFSLRSNVDMVTEFLYRYTSCIRFAHDSISNSLLFFQY